MLRYAWALVALFGAIAVHAQDTCSDPRAASAVNQEIFENIWNAPFTHVLAAKVGVSPEPITLITGTITQMKIYKVDTDGYHNMVKSAFTLQSTELVNITRDRNSEQCHADLIYHVYKLSDAEMKIIGRTRFFVRPTDVVRVPISFSINSSNGSAGWKASQVSGADGLAVDIANSVEAVYASTLQTLFNTPKGLEGIAQLRKQAMADNTAMFGSPREQMLARQCENRGGYWGHHIIKTMENGHMVHAESAGDPDHCITD